VTTDYCVDETLTLLIARRQHRRALEAGDFFFQSALCRMHFLTPDEIRRAWFIFPQRSAAGWSFTDCTSKIVIDQLRIGTAISLDAHFAQFGDVVVAP
jgi:predicted nucleic acid-binding protein